MLSLVSSDELFGRFELNYDVDILFLNESK